MFLKAKKRIVSMETNHQGFGLYTWYMIVRLSVLNLNRNVGNKDGPFDKLCRSHAS